MNIVLALREHGTIELEELSVEEDQLKQRLLVIRRRRMLLLDIIDRIQQDANDPEVVGKAAEPDQAAKSIIDMARHRAKRHVG